MYINNNTFERERERERDTCVKHIHIQFGVSCWLKANFELHSEDNPEEERHQAFRRHYILSLSVAGLGR